MPIKASCDAELERAGGCRRRGGGGWEWWEESMNGGNRREILSAAASQCRFWFSRGFAPARPGLGCCRFMLFLARLGVIILATCMKCSAVAGERAPFPCSMPKIALFDTNTAFFRLGKLQNNAMLVDGRTKDGMHRSHWSAARRIFDRGEWMSARKSATLPWQASAVE